MTAILTGIVTMIVAGLVVVCPEVPAVKIRIVLPAVRLSMTTQRTLFVKCEECTRKVTS